MKNYIGITTEEPRQAYTNFSEFETNRPHIVVDFSFRAGYFPGNKTDKDIETLQKSLEITINNTIKEFLKSKP